MNNEENAVRVDDIGEAVGVGDHEHLPPQDEPVLENPKECIDWKTIGPLILDAINWSKAERRSNAKGVDYYTTTAHSVNIVQGGFRYQFGLSVNRFPETKDKEQGLTPKEKAAAKMFGMTDQEALQLKTLKASGSQNKIDSLRR